MAQAADCAALIIDLRDANGDGQAMARCWPASVLEDKRSYIFKDKQLHLHDQIDRDGKVVAEFWTSADAPASASAARSPCICWSTSARAARPRRLPTICSST
jgi:hypothetical protein